MFLQGMETFEHYLVYRPKRRRSSENLILPGAEQIGKINLEITYTDSLVHVKYGYYCLIFVKQPHNITC
jgi:hypothetical protein